MNTTIKISIGKRAITFDGGLGLDKRFDGVRVQVCTHYREGWRAIIEGHGAYASEDAADPQTAIDKALKCYRRHAASQPRDAVAKTKRERRLLGALLRDHARQVSQYERDVELAEADEPKAIARAAKAKAALR
jgi:hypothetical protein